MKETRKNNGCKTGHKVEKVYETLFEYSPVALWEEDASELKKYIDRLKQEGITDIKEYFDAHPEAVLKCTSLIRIVNVNTTAVQFYKAKNKEELLGSLDKIFSEKSLGMLKQLVAHLAAGHTTFEGDSFIRTCDGQERNTLLRVSLVPGSEKTWACVLLFELDFTERRQMQDAIRKSEKEYRNLVENAHSVILKWNTGGCITFANDYAASFFGYPKDGLVGSFIMQLFSAENEKTRELSLLVEDIFRNPAKYSNMEHENVRANKERVWVAWTNRAVTDESGKVTEILSIGNDITRIKRAEESLRRRENEFRVLIENSPDIIVRLDACMRHLYVNPVVEELTGMPKENIVGKTFVELGMPEKKVRFWEAHIQKVFDTGREETVEFDFNGLYGPRYFQSRLVPDRPSKDRPVESVIVISRDITDRVRFEEKIKYISFHDRITGLYNRTYFDEELKRLDTPRQLPLSIIMGDINNLKMVNDAFGHAEGDRLLKMIGGIIKASCRDEDIVARWGGDEFVVLLPRTDINTALEVSRRIKKGCGETGGEMVQPTIGLGIAVKQYQEEDIDETLRNAEDRMYRNKLIESRGLHSTAVSALLGSLRKRGVTSPRNVRELRDLVAGMGEALKLNREQKAELVLSAVLHDIGKTAISDEILAKKGPLSRDEWLSVKKHPEIGYRIIKSFDEMSYVSDYILSHHEHWDGSGYPKGLAGEEIPLVSRILLIADAYLAMIHGRAYHRPMSSGEALDELQRHSGKEFDPRLVEVFVARHRPRIPVLKETLHH